MSHVVKRVLDLTPATGAVVELAEGDELVYRATSGAAESHLGLRLLRENSLSGLCIAQGQTLSCDDSETDPRVDQEACRLIGLRSMIVVPLRHDVQVVGVLKVYSSLPRNFDDTDEEILSLLSDLIASAMFNATQNESGARLARSGGTDEVMAHASRIDECLRAAFDFESQPITLAVSIGAAIYPDQGEDIIQLMDVADQAIYAAKRAGALGKDAPRRNS